jgi:hypothetical protein
MLTLLGTIDTGENRLGTFTQFGGTIAYPPREKVSFNHNNGIATHPQYHINTIFPGGSIASDSQGNACELSVDTTAFAVANLQTREVFRHEMSGSYEARSLVQFNAGVVNSFQFYVVGNSETSYSYANVDGFFGILYFSQGRQAVAILTVTVAAGGAEVATVTLNSVPYQITLTNAVGDVNFTAHQIEIGGTGGVTYGDWLVEHIGDKVIFTAQGLDARNGVYGFTSLGTAAGTMAQVRTGAESVPSFIPQQLWNVNPLPTLDPTTWNTYSIEWGLGCVKFSVLDPLTCMYTKVHEISLLGTANYFTPNVYVQHLIASNGSTTAFSMKTAGTSVTRFGDEAVLRRPQRAVNNTKTGVTTEEIILAIASRQTINTHPSEAEIVFNDMTVSTDGTKSVTITLYLNPTTLGLDTAADYTDWEYVDESNSPMLLDTAIQNFTGGDPVIQFTMGKVDTVQFKFSEQLQLYMHTTDIVLITAQSAGANDVSISLITTEIL